MLLNHIKFAVRLFLKDSVYSILNILGLALGIAVGIILLLYLQSEFTYDRHHQKHEQIYRLTHHLKADGADFNTSVAARELAPVLKEELPEVLDYARFIRFPTVMVQSKSDDGSRKQFYEERIFTADSTAFSFFTHRFIEGDARTCLQGTNKVVLTESVAWKYFGDGPAVGKMLVFPGNELREVSAVVSDLPDNTHFKYEMLLSHIPPRPWVAEGDASRKSEGFWNPDSYTYLLLPPSYDPSTFYQKFHEVIFEKTFGVFAKQINGTVTPRIQPLADIHFHAGYDDDEPAGNLAYVYAFSGIGIFIMLLACINYMNMATARSVVRTSEMGVRKVLGFSKAALFRNVMLEALLMAFFAMLVGIVLAYMVLEATPFNSLIEKKLTLNFFSNPLLLTGTLTITALVGVLAGIYPAVYIPSVPVVVALKGTFTGDKTGAVLRKTLIVTQFVISLLVIICTVLMDRQIDFVQRKELGFTKDNILLIDIRDTATENRMESIKAELLKNPNIVAAATGHGTPGLGVGSNVFRVERDSVLAQQNMNLIWAGHDFVETMGIELVDGRGFRKDTENEYHRSFLVNETGARELGWAENAVGKRVRFFHGEQDAHVVGVIKDFNFQSLHSPIGPLFIVLTSHRGGRLHIRLKGTDLPQTIEYVEGVMSKFDPNHPFEYTFLDQAFGRQYRADQTQQQLISSLSYICIFISLLGLIGLSAFTASRKAKEISIRKVLGASVPAIVMLFSRDYFKLIIIAFVISVPLADYVITEWMSKFAYQMPVSWLYFVVPGVLVLFLGLLTVSLQSLKSAKANPVDGLRRE